MNTRYGNSGWRAFAGLALMAALTMVVFIPAQARAQVLAASTNTDAVIYSDNHYHYLPINGASTTLNFTTTQNYQKVVVLFNAECSVQASDRSSFVDTDVMIDGIIAPPSDSDNAFCTSDGHNVLSNRVSASTNVVRVVYSAGAHEVRVRVSLKNFTEGERYRIDDSSTIVMK